MKNKPWFWPLLCVLAALPGAFFGVCLGSVIGYERERAVAVRTHTPRPEDHPALNQCEAAGALLGALPGVAVVTLFWLRAKPIAPQFRRHLSDTDDGTVWPPPPREG